MGDSSFVGSKVHVDLADTDTWTHILKSYDIIGVINRENDEEK